MKRIFLLIALALSLTACASNNETGESVPGLVDGDIIKVKYRGGDLYCIDGYHTLSCDYNRFYKEFPNAG